MTQLGEGGGVRWCQDSHCCCSCCWYCYCFYCCCCYYYCFYCYCFYCYCFFYYCFFCCCYCCYCCYSGRQSIHKAFTALPPLNSMCGWVGCSDQCTAYKATTLQLIGWEIHRKQRSVLVDDDGKAVALLQSHTQCTLSVCVNLLIVGLKSPEVEVAHSALLDSVNSSKHVSLCLWKSLVGWLQCFGKKAVAVVAWPDGSCLTCLRPPCSHTDIDPPMYVHSSQLHCTAPTVRSTYVHSSAVQCSHSDMDPPMQQDTVLPPMATLQCTAPTLISTSPIFTM